MILINMDKISNHNQGSDATCKSDLNDNNLTVNDTIHLFVLRIFDLEINHMQLHTLIRHGYDVDGGLNLWR